MQKINLGIIGFGSVGRFFSQKIYEDNYISDLFNLVFVWNRSSLKKDDLSYLDPVITAHYSACGLPDALADFSNQGKSVDLLAEVAHPSIINDYGKILLKYANLYTASVTAFSSDKELSRILEKAKLLNRSIYIPSGAAWGVQDIQKYAATGNLKSLHITMSFHADALKLNSPLKEELEKFQSSPSDKGPLTLFEGDIRELAAMAPNNVNTMMCVLLAVQNAIKAEVIGTLKAHKDDDAHITEIEVKGIDGFEVKTRRYNPAKKGAVTGNNTYDSFLNSLCHARGASPGLHFC
jgi:aspartate dehydrogenase